jgi:hypothetical protein
MLRIEQLKPADLKREYEKWVASDIPWESGFVIENFLHDMLPYVTDLECRYSGFWSQGDGASFTGSVNLLAVLDLIDTDNNYILYRELMRCKELTPYTRVVLYGNYCHEKTMRLVEPDANTRGWIVPSGIFMGLDLRTLHEDGAAESERMLDKMVEDASDIVLEWLRDKAGELYRNLEEDYESSTSKEAFVQWAKDTEMEFDYEYDDTEDCDRSDQQQGDESNVDLLPNQDPAAR